MSRARQRRGFSLIELMVAVGIAAVLAAAAIPSWRAHVRRVHRTEAIRALLALAAAQERHHLRHGRYASALGGTDDAAAERLPVATTADGGRYRLAIEAGDELTFTARATASGGQAEDTQCAVLSIDETGERRAEDAAGRRSDSRCWR